MLVREAPWNHPTANRSLWYRLYQPSPSRGLVLLIHGFGEHSGRYEGVARALAQQSLSVACPDLRGHGRSTGQRGDVQRCSEYLEDLDALVREVILPMTHHDRYALFGHSAGGLLVLLWAIVGSPAHRALIIQSPLLAVGYPVPRWKSALAGWLTRAVPRLSVPIGLDPSWLSHDPLVAQRYRTDPLVHDRITLRGYAALQTAMREAHEGADRVRLPTLMLYGAEDRVISLAACRDVFERLTCEKRLLAFEGCYHELHFEPVQPQVIAALAQWVHAHA